MPNQPKTTQRSIRIGDALWRSAQAKAAQEGVTVSDVVREMLEAYGYGYRVV